MAQVQDAKFFENALKNHYLPVWKNQLGTEPSPLLGKIKRVPAVGNEIIAAAPIGLSGGFGFSEEGRRTPAAGAVVYEQFKERVRDMYVNINISHKVMKMSANNAGAMVNALDAEVKASYEAAKWNVGRALFGNGTGTLANVSATTGNVIPVDSTRLLKEGLIIDIYPTGAPIGSAPAVAGRRILAIDRANKTIWLDGASVAVPDGFVTIQYSYGLEITGVGAIFDDSIDSIYGLKKSEKPWLKPVVKDCDHNLEDGYITDALREALDVKNSKIDMLLCGDKAFDHYVDYLRTNNVRNEKSDLTIEGGFKAIAFVFGNSTVAIVNERFVPVDECWGFATGSLEMHLLDDWDFVAKDGGFFTLINDTSIYRALLACYGNLLCTNPGGCVRLTNCV